MRDHWSENVEYLNPDQVAQEKFGGWNNATAIVQAANWVTQRREELLTQKLGIAFESVFSAADKVTFLKRAKQAGYFLRCFFVSTGDPRINASRVADRVLNGGHSVPIEKIISRYARSMANLTAAIEVSDRVYIFDNSVDGVEATLCARTQDGKLRKIYANLPQWVADVVSGLPRHGEFVDLRHTT